MSSGNLVYGFEGEGALELGEDGLDERVKLGVRCSGCESSAESTQARDLLRVFAKG